MTAILPGRARELALALTERRSVNGTADEASYSPFLQAIAAGIPFFKTHPGNLWLEPIPGDALGRSAVVALVKGTGPRTVILTGHFDTIPTGDYGPLESFATDPQNLLPQLVERLSGSKEDTRALDDLASGRFLPGRGLLDMKSGLAAGLASLEAFSSRVRPVGNLLFVAVPDEENSSAGMRALALRLPEIALENDLELCLVINLDALGDEGDGGRGQVVALGNIGKTLLSAYIVGRETHACYPFAGLSASLIAAELVRLIEYAPHLADGSSPPPSTLAMRDLKGPYDVTTPSRAWCLWNVISRERKASDFLAMVKQCSRDHLSEMCRRIGKCAFVAGAEVFLDCILDESIQVITFDELVVQIVERRPTFRAEVALAAKAIAHLPGLDLPTRAQKITEFVWRESRRSGPAVILGFASVPYPATKTLGQIDQLLLDCISGVVQVVGRRHGVQIRLADRLDVIADTSFVGPVDTDDLKTVATNTPTWGTAIKWNLTQPATPGLPTINAGPWGRGYHTWLERVQIHYAFEVLPDLVLSITEQVLEPRERDGGSYA
jgi:arginine utilization protein RocB